MSVTLLKSDMMFYVARYLNDPGHVLWNTTVLSRFINEGETELSRFKSTIWRRFPLDIHAGVAVYDLPPFLKAITYITYMGFRVDFLNQATIATMSPVYRTQGSRPRWATMELEGFHKLRLFPFPTQDLPIIDDDSTIYTDTNILNSCVVSAFFYPDPNLPTLQLPVFVERRTLKAYIMWQCYRMQGPGQNLKNAKYWNRKWNKLRAEYIMAVNAAYSAIISQYDSRITRYPWKKASPVLPPNFGPIVRY